MKDYYRVLGVLDDAEDIIIRAAYKALAQRYHPDKWTGDKEGANKKMSAINEAYEVLSDSAKRKAYDEEYFKYRARDEADGGSDDDTSFVNEEDENWQMAIEFFPQVRADYDYLSKLSKIVANTFKISLIESKNFKESSFIKSNLEKEYLRRYYGENIWIQKFAKNLLLMGEYSAAIEVNKIVRYMGRSVGEAQVATRLLEKFSHLREIHIYDIEYFIQKISKGLVTKQEIINLLELPSVGAKNISISDDGDYGFSVGSAQFTLTRWAVLDFLLNKLSNLHRA